MPQKEQVKFKLDVKNLMVVDFVLRAGEGEKGERCCVSVGMKVS